MNKQALAFLTLFSLILMLSVYYVTLPTDATTTVMNEENKENTEETAKETEEETQETKEAGKEEKPQEAPANDERTSLQSEADKKKDDEITKNSSVVSAADKSEAEKQQALETIEQLKDAKAQQQELAQALLDSGYMCAVELSEPNCIITVFEQEESKETAKKIMKVVNSKLNQQYSIQVSFK